MKHTIEANEVVFNPQLLEVNTTSVRRYGKDFYAWGDVKYNGCFYAVGDPFPGSKFPAYEGAIHVISVILQSAPVSITEKNFRHLFKGIKNGANKYAYWAELMEKKGLNII